MILQGKDGALGHGDFHSQCLPKKIAFPQNEKIISIAALGGLNMAHSLFVTSSGKTLSCGSNDRYQLGKNTYEPNECHPSPVSGSYL